MRDEAISTARQRLDETRRLRVIAERRADSFNAEVHALLIIHEGFIAPDFPLNLLARHDLTGLSGEKGKNLERLWLQFDERAVPAQLTALEFQFEGVEANHRFSRSIRAHIAYLWAQVLSRAARRLIYIGWLR